MEHLQQELDQFLKQLPNQQEVRDRLDALVSVYPFNEYEYIISTLLAMDVLNLDTYHELRDEYIARNLFLYVFEISAPRKFGESILFLRPASWKCRRGATSRYPREHQSVDGIRS